MFYVPKIKTDVDRFGNFIDSTIGISVLCIAPMNCDFDGDEINITAILDREMHSQFQRLETHLTTLDLDRPWTVSSSIGLMPPMLSTLCNWLHRTD